MIEAEKIETVFFSDCEQHLLTYQQFDDFEMDCATIQSKIKMALSTLSPIEADIITRRFGLFDFDVETLKGIGLNAWNRQDKKTGLTSEAVRQIERRALRRLRHPLRARFLK